MAKNKATLNIDPGLHHEIKVEAAKQRLKISELAERLMRGGLKKAK